MCEEWPAVRTHNPSVPGSNLGRPTWHALEKPEGLPGSQVTSEARGGRPDRRRPCASGSRARSDNWPALAGIARLNLAWACDELGDRERARALTEDELHQHVRVRADRRDRAAIRSGEERGAPRHPSALNSTKKRLPTPGSRPEADGRRGRRLRPRVLGGLDEKTPASEARYGVASTRDPG
jgi:hypothetical protein